MATTETSDVPRRGRMKYTNEQLTKLEAVFSENHYPDSKTQNQLAVDLGVPVERLMTWFQNRRSKFKRQSKNDHVMWMRKQIFSNEGGKNPNFPFGTPQLPVLTSSCHVLSPPDTTQYGRQDTAWERPSSSLEIHQSPSTDFNTALDLRTCVSPDSRPSSTPKDTPMFYHSKHTPAPARETYHHRHMFSTPQLSPCRFSTPSPISTPPVSNNRVLSPAHAQSFPRNILPPVAFPGDFHQNWTGFFGNSSFSYPSSSVSLHDKMNPYAQDINLSPWLLQTAVPNAMTTSDYASAVPQNTINKAARLSSPWEYCSVEQNKTCARTKRKHSHICEASQEERTSNKRLKLRVLPATGEDYDKPAIETQRQQECNYSFVGTECSIGQKSNILQGMTNENCSTKIVETSDPEEQNIGNSSLQVDLEQWF